MIIRKKEEIFADSGSILTLNFGELVIVMEEPQIVGIVYSPEGGFLNQVIAMRPST